MQIKDIRIKRVTETENKTIFGIVYSKFKWVSNVLQVKYNDDWVSVNVVEEEKAKPKKFLCGNEYRNKEKRCLKQCGNCQGNV